MFCHGFGVVTPFGVGKLAMWEAMKKNLSAIRIYPQDQPESTYLELGARIETTLLSHCPDFNPDLMVKRLAMVRLALEEALAQSGFSNGFPKEAKVGLYLGAGFYPSDQSIKFMNRYLKRPEPGQDHFGFDPVNALCRTLALPQWLEGKDYDLWLKDRLLSKPGALLEFSRKVLGGSGDTLLTNNLCVSSLQSLDQAFRALALGDCDYAVVGGVEELSPISYYTFQRLGAHSKARDASIACLPFDSRRQGIVLGEAAGFLIFSRSAKGAICSVSATASSNNCYHMTDPGIDGEGLYKAMMACLGPNQEAPDVIVAHGTGTELNDPSECNAIRRLPAKAPFVQSIKSRFGHTLAAAGSLNVIAAILQAQNQFFVPTLGLTNIDPACDVNHIPPQGISLKPQRVLCNASGFGGYNCSALLSFSGENESP